MIHVTTTDSAMPIPPKTGIVKTVSHSSSPLISKPDLPRNHLLYELLNTQIMRKMPGIVGYQMFHPQNLPVVYAFYIQIATRKI